MSMYSTATTPAPTSEPAAASAYTASAPGSESNKKADVEGIQHKSEREKGSGRGARLRGSDRQSGKARQKRQKDGVPPNKDFNRSRRDQVADDRANKRRKVIEETGAEGSHASIQFTSEEIAAEARRPKRKVAVLIGYAGTGYHGIQINHKDKTIEGELFKAFVDTGAISKANADDPKKSSLMRCARTDKGVHAAGNVLSLKMIIEDADIVDKINERLPDQIRVWGVQRMPNSFSSYHACDSRWYEYLMPSYALLPPHPDSFLGKKLLASAKECGMEENYKARLGDVQDFWEQVEKDDVHPILKRIDPIIKDEVLRLLKSSSDQDYSDELPAERDGIAKDAKAMEADCVPQEQPGTSPEGGGLAVQNVITAQQVPTESAADAVTVPPSNDAAVANELTPADLAVREIKAAYVKAKRQFRVTSKHLERLQMVLNQYHGTRNYHNYTVQKSFDDPSAQRHIKSFTVDPTPIQIRDTEWLSIKVHGQSFMMHQIRKMIAMAVLTLRCGAPPGIVQESYGRRRISIPKAPSLGLMLERPMFTEHNKKLKREGKDPVDFAKYEDKIQKFKDDFIYKRMFELEERENSFHMFFHQIDSFRTDHFLWLTAAGFEAAAEPSVRRDDRIPRGLQRDLGDEADGITETCD